MKTSTLLVAVLLVAVIAFSGCAKKAPVENNTVTGSMEDNGGDTGSASAHLNITPPPEENTTVPANVTGMPANESVNDTMVINGSGNADYSEYRDTSGIDASIDDIQSTI